VIDSIKHQALRHYLQDQGISKKEIDETLDEYDASDEYTHALGEELRILFDDEADEACQDYILESLWAFNADFIASHVCEERIDDYDDLLKSIRSIQEQCEGANSAIKAMINDLGQFIQDAISADGRGHFLSSYDGHEYETAIKIEEKLENSTGHPTFTSMTHWVYIYRV